MNSLSEKIVFALINRISLNKPGLPDCTMYSHAAATGKPTGFVVKFNDNGDQTVRRVCSGVWGV